MRGHLPEALFDLDFPGHYLRRIKSVSLTIPCVTGPYSSVPCTLTLLKHSMRQSSMRPANTRATSRMTTCASWMFRSDSVHRDQQRAERQWTV